MSEITPETLWEEANRRGLRIQVTPQDRIIQTLEGQRIESENLWQWTVKRGNSANLKTGHSCTTPTMAWDRAADALREIVAEGATENAATPASASGGFTGVNFDSVNFAYAGTVSEGVIRDRYYPLTGGRL